MSLRSVSILFVAGLLAGLLGGGLPAAGVLALVPPEPGADAGTPVESWLVSLEGPSVYRRLMADAEGAALVAAQVPTDIAPLARRLEAEVLESQHASLRAAEGLGIRVISRYSTSANGLLVHATAAQAAALLGQAGVSRVEPALMVRPQLTMSRPHIGATRLASELGYDGSGSYVAVIDTGVDYTHAHLGGPGDPAVWTAATAAGATEVITDTYAGERIFPNDKVVAGWDFVGRRYNPPHICTDADMAAGTCTNIPEPDPDPIDGGNHGTHVSGIVAGEAIDGIGDGIAPGAKIVGLKLYGRGGADEAIDLLADAIDYCTRVNLGIEDRGVTPPRVDAINTSLGEVWAQGSRLFDEIVEAAVGSGIAIASSAGNSGDVPFVQNAPPASPKMMSIASSVPPSESKVLEVVARWEDQEARYDGIDSSLVSFADKGAVEGELAWYGDACSDADGNPTPPVQEQAEKVSLIARGTCTFSEKLLNAQAAGAIAVVMYTDNRAKNAMGGGADGIDIPSLMIDNANGLALQALLEAGTAVSVSIDPAKIRIVPLPGDAVSGFSSRGPSKNGALKPDITAPGSEIVSALAGSGTGGAAVTGTSMASPMVAGAAAVIQQRNRDEGLGLDGLGISQLLMNYARPVIYAGNPDNRMPVVRQGAGLVDLWGAGTGKLRVAAGDIASINLGMVSLTEAWETTRTMTVYNHGAEAAQVQVSAGFRSADDADMGMTVTLPEGPLSVPAGGSIEVSVGFGFDPAALRDWTQWPELAGSDAGQMDALELDGWVLVTPSDAEGQPLADAPVVTVPFYALPRRASAIAAAPLPEALEAPTSPLTLTNSADYPGRAELFALPLAAIPSGADPAGDPEADVAGGLDPDEPEILEELDIRAVGLRVEPATEAMTQTMLSFAIARHASAAIPRVTRYDIFVDANADGVIDHRIWETVIGGRVMTHYGAWDAEAGAMVEGSESDAFARHTTDLHSYVSTLSIPLAALGEDEPKPFLFYVTNFGTNEDWLFKPGTRYERVPNLDVAPDGALAADGPRYFFDPNMLARLPEAWSFELAGGTTVEVALARGPGEVDASWLLVYASNAHDGVDRQAQVLVPGAEVSPPRPAGLFLPLLLRAFDLAGQG